MVLLKAQQVKLYNVAAISGSPSDSMFSIQVTVRRAALRNGRARPLLLSVYTRTVLKVGKSNDFYCTTTSNFFQCIDGQYVEYVVTIITVWQQLKSFLSDLNHSLKNSVRFLQLEQVSHTS